MLQYYKISELYDPEILKYRSANRIDAIHDEQFILSSSREIAIALAFSVLKKDRLIGEFLMANKILDRNVCEGRYFSDSIDREAEKLSLHGLGGVGISLQSW